MNHSIRNGLTLLVLVFGQLLCADLGVSSEALRQSEIELRHPKDGGFYWKKNKRTWVRFYWRQGDPVSRDYTLQVSRSKNFADIIYEKNLNDAPHIWETKLIGWMYWRVVRLDGNGMPLASTERRRFKILPEDNERQSDRLDYQPQDTLSRLGIVPKSELELRHPQRESSYWQANKQAWVRFYYRFNSGPRRDLLLQVSDSPDFEDVLHQTRLRDRPYEWRSRNTGRFYWRLGVLNEDERLEGFTPPRTFVIHSHSAGWQKEPRARTMSLSSKKARVVKPKPVPVTVKPNKIAKLDPNAAKKIEKNAFLLTKGYDGETIEFARYAPNAAFTWQDVSDSDSYLFELSKDRGFNKVLVKKRLETSSYSLAGLGQGRYYWRVTASYKGNPVLESKVKTFAFKKVRSGLKAPILEKPENDRMISAVSKSQSVSFSWKRLEGDESHSFAMAISRKKNFSEAQLLTSLRTSKSLLLEPGVYFWRVKQISPDGNESPWSKHSSFKVVLSKRKIALKAPTKNQKIRSFEVEFQWQKVSSCEDYQLKVSDTADFSNVVASKETDDLDIEFELDDEREYYWTVSCRDSNGVRVQSEVSRFIIDFSGEELR